MTAAEWIALATLCAIVIIAVVGGAWKQGRDAGEIKALLKAALDQFERGDKRIDALEVRFNGHDREIAQIKAHVGLDVQRAG